jgi:nucleoid-associated protein YgaU
MAEDNNKQHIGIKMADGSFYPVFTEDFQGQKKLILTTAKDEQTSVQIDLYKGQEGPVTDALYIGSLIIEELKPAPKGEPEIELFVGIDNEGNLTATASDLSTGEKQSLTVSLESLAESETYDMPDFVVEEGEEEEIVKTELGEEEEIVTTEVGEEEEIVKTELGEEEDVIATQVGDEEESLLGETYPLEQEDRRKTHIQKKKVNPLFVVLFVLLGLIIIAGAAIGIFLLLKQDSSPALSKTTETTQQTQEQTTTTETQTETQETTNAETQAAKQESEQVTETTAGEEETTETETITGTSSEATGGEMYTVKRGDTLWDIARQYYRDPFLYPVISNYSPNNIKNPDLIFENQEIYIPDR